LIGAGLCTLRELSDGTYNINDWADMHEYLDLQEHVESIEEKRLKQKMQ